MEGLLRARGGDSLQANMASDGGKPRDKRLRPFVIRETDISPREEGGRTFFPGDTSGFQHLADISQADQTRDESRKEDPLG